MQKWLKLAFQIVCECNFTDPSLLNKAAAFEWHFLFAKKSPKSWKIKLSICAEQLGLYPEDYIFLFPFFCGKSYIFRESSSSTLIYILYNSVDPCLLNDAESWINQLIHCEYESVAGFAKFSCVHLSYKHKCWLKAVELHENQIDLMVNVVIFQLNS